MLEKDFQLLVTGAARAHGLICYHTFDSRKSAAGFPDLVIVGASKVIYRELKTDTGKPSGEQLFWLAALREAGADVGIWRPVHWPKLINEQLKSLGRVKIVRPPMTQAEARKRLAARHR